MSVSIFGVLAESIVFAYIGLCLFTYANSTLFVEGKEAPRNIWSYSFIGYMIPIIVFGRFMSIYLTYFMFSCCHKEKLTCKQLTFISYGGVIRGAIAFGLVLKIPESEDFHERDVLITTTLSIVIFTTLLFGTFMPLAQRILVPPTPEQVYENDTEEEVSNAVDGNTISVSHYDNIVHPNDENDIATVITGSVS